ncbi:MAG: response regulator [Deltaproteobacteria bacterium]|nr:response regulator [Deltaproteobacteria bacterium]
MSFVLMGVSITMQMAAAFLAFYHLRKKPRIYAWSFVAVALFLMGIRRLISLSATIQIKNHSFDPRAESVALIISILMFLGVWKIGSVFEHIDNLVKKSEKELKKRKFIQNELLKSQNELRKSHEQLLSVFNTSDELLIFGIDEQEKVIFWNISCEKTFGVKHIDAIGKELESIVSPVDKNRKLLDKFKNIYTPDIHLLPMEISVLTKESTGITLYSTCIPIKLPDGRKEIFFINLDITEKQIRAKEQIKIARLESLGIVAGGIAHDFNNLLTGVFGNIELAQMSISAESESFLYLDDAKSSIAKSRELTRKLLTFSMGGNPDRQPIDIIKIIKDLVPTKITNSEIAVFFDFANNIENISGDKYQLEEAFSEILKNAVQAMPDGGKLEIKMFETKAFESRGNQYLRIEFTDSGEGIPEENLDRIFEPYFTTRNIGDGLGLAIAHSIIKKHDGFILVESQLGKGSRFSILLPGIFRYIREKNSNSVNDVNNIKPCRILIMDDDPVVRTTLERAVASMGLKAISTPDGDSALIAYENEKSTGNGFDLVILDLTVPEGSGGLETAQAILRIDPEARLIVSSGFSNDPIMFDYKKYGFSGVISKPWEYSELKNLIHEIVSNGKMI